MKVLQINAVYGHGSTGTIVRDIEQLCEQNGIECYVASPDPKVREAKRGYVIGNALDHKLHALLCRINGMQGYFSHIPTWNLCRDIDRIKPDVVHLHNLHSNYIHLNILLKYLAKKNIRTVITLHDCWFYTGGCFHYTAAKCDKWLKSCGQCPKKKQDTPAYMYDCSSRILADRKKYLLEIPYLYITGVSEWITSEAKRTFFCNCPAFTIYNGVNLSAFHFYKSNLRNRLGLTGKKILLGPAMKWLAPVNRSTLDFFLSHMSNDEVLLLFGSANKHDDLPKHVIQYGFINNIFELVQLYSIADVFVNCTREESLSLINIEAQACGTPVVTYDGTGVQETVDGVISLAVPAGHPDMLLYAARKILKSPPSYNEVRRWVMNRFEINNNYKSYIRLYYNTLI